jgi:LysR family transcriptional regulator, low CO2-responsive transcriptional regulator
MGFFSLAASVIWVVLSTGRAKLIQLAWLMLDCDGMPAIKPVHNLAEPFDARQLRILTVLSVEPSLSAAARKLSLTQSAVSHALKKLEEDAGTRLVERNERGAELTQAGQTLLRRAHAVFHQMQLAREELHKLKHWGTQRLRFGASSTACQYLLPVVLKEFSKKHPKCHVEVSAGDSASRLTALSEGRIDLAIITHTALDAVDVELTKLFDETLCLITPAGGSLRVALPFIGYLRGSSLSLDAMQWFDRSGRTRPLPAMELESLDAIKAMVKLGLGSAVLPSWVVQAELDEGSLCAESSDLPVQRTWSLAMRRGHRLSLSEATWVGCCKAVELGRLRLNNA